MNKSIFGRVVRLNTFSSPNNNETHITDANQLARELINPGPTTLLAFREEGRDVPDDFSVSFH